LSVLRKICRNSTNHERVKERSRTPRFILVHLPEGLCPVSFPTSIDVKISVWPKFKRRGGGG